MSTPPTSLSSSSSSSFSNYYDSKNGSFLQFLQRRRREHQQRPLSLTIKSVGLVSVTSIVTAAVLMEYYADWKEKEQILNHYQQKQKQKQHQIGHEDNGENSLKTINIFNLRQQQELQQQQHYHYHQDLLLPRTYDRDIISDYWMQRPISITRRLGQIIYELAPIVGGYLYHFKLKSSLSPSFSNTTDAHDETNPDIKQTTTSSSSSSSYLQQYYASKLRHALTRLGPAWVKGGQQLSIRPDLVPPIVLKELQKLCDSVQPIPDEIAFQVIRDELQLNNNNINGDDELHQVFENLHLVAAASIGQVYKGTITTTTTSTINGNDNSKTNSKNATNTTTTTQKMNVAIKVQRPGMRKSFSLDLFLLQKWGDLVDAFTSRFTQQAPYHRAFFDNFSHGSYSELDYEQEAANQKYFQSELAKRGNCNNRVIVPNVYDEYTSEKVLTTQWMDGVKLADSPQEQIRELIPIGVELFLTQLLDIGAFHADPHPGNLLVTNSTNNHDGRDNGKKQQTLCLLDFGLCATVDPKSRDGMTNAIVHLLSRDFDSLVTQDAKVLGFLPHDFDTTELKPILTKVLTGGLLESGSNLHNRKRKLLEISNELNEIFFRYPFQVPPFFALVTRGLGLLEGIALTGDPEFDIFRASAPYATKRAMAMLGRKMRSTRNSRKVGA